MNVNCFGKYVYTTGNIIPFTVERYQHIYHKLFERIVILLFIY